MNMYLPEADYDGAPTQDIWVSPINEAWAAYAK